MNINVKKLAILCAALIPMQLYAQNSVPAKSNWHLLDLKADNLFGISMEKTYAELLKGKPHQPVVVAVLDGGVDVKHEDLKAVIWKNPKEIAGNGKDDDGNGFIDDIHGWNFYSKMVKGEEEFDLMALAKKGVKNADARKELDAKLLPAQQRLKTLKSDELVLNGILKKIGKANPTGIDFRNYIPSSAQELNIQTNLVQGLKVYPDYIDLMRFQNEREMNMLEIALAYEQNPDYDLVTGGPTAHHGTHIAGIIAAVRGNGKGVDGIADDAKIMVVRTTSGFKMPREEDNKMTMTLMVPAGNEDLKVVAKSIRYAVDNGAKVINMSFGNTVNWKSAELDSAVNYAAAKDVLMVHSAGNLGVDLDVRGDYPGRKTPEGQAMTGSWINVGASGWKDDEKLVGSFSNYGKTNVDVFAPGMAINSTAPLNTYWTDGGTSMAAPVVSGLAAVIRSYYPKLTAVQVKDIIVKSVVKRDILKDKCVSGGIVNAYDAIQLASTY